MGCVKIETPALIDDRAVMFKAKSKERVKNSLGGGGAASWGVEILHAEQPPTLTRACIEVAGRGGEEGTEVKRSGRRRGEAAYVAQGKTGVGRTKWWALTGSNCGPPACKAGALTG